MNKIIKNKVLFFIQHSSSILVWCARDKFTIFDREQYLIVINVWEYGSAQNVCD